jgi:hypothetical protein
MADLSLGELNFSNYSRSEVGACRWRIALSEAVGVASALAPG